MIEHLLYWPQAVVIQTGRKNTEGEVSQMEAENSSLDTKRVASNTPASAPTYHVELMSIPYHLVSFQVEGRKECI